MSKAVEYIITAAIAFTVPTLVIAEKWGALGSSMEHVAETVEKIDGKADRISAKQTELVERVSRIEGYLDR